MEEHIVELNKDILMAEKNTQPSKTLSKMKIGSVFLIDPTLQPKMAKP